MTYTEEIMAMDLSKIREIAEKQFSDPDNPENIGFDCGGQFIVDPWMDYSGRFPISTEKAIELYGAINLRCYIEDISERYNVNQLELLYPVGSEVIYIGSPTRAFTLNPGTAGTVEGHESGRLAIAWRLRGSSGRTIIMHGHDEDPASVRLLSDNIVTITCNGETKVWDRSEAESFFLQGMMECEGSEQARYASIYGQIVSGESSCSDEK